MKRRNSSSLLAIFVAVFLVVSCGSQKEIVITVGERSVTKKEFEQAYRQFVAGTAASRLSKASLVSQFIEGEILRKEAGKMGIALAGQEISAFLTENSIDEKKKATAELFILRNKVAEKITRAGADINARVAELSKEMPDVIPDRIVFLQVLLNSEGEAQKVLGEIRRGLAFEEAAKKYSGSPEGKRGGLIDYLNADELPRELFSALNTMKAGEISEVVKSPYGFHILMLKEFSRGRTLGRDEKEKAARIQARKELTGDTYAEWYAGKRKEYEVTVKWELIEKVN